MAIAHEVFQPRSTQDSRRQGGRALLKALG